MPPSLCCSYKTIGSNVVVSQHECERYCSDGGDSSALSGQTLLCSGIVFALESEVPGSNLEAGTDTALQYHCYICILATEAEARRRYLATIFASWDTPEVWVFP